MIRVIRQETIHKTFYELNNGEIVTVPDQVDGINEMLIRFRRGELATKRSVFNNDTELPDLRKMDLTEVDELKRNLTDTIYNEKSKQKSLRKAHNDFKTAQKQNQGNSIDSSTRTVSGLDANNQTP